MTHARPSRDVLGTALRRFWVVALVAALVAGLATVLLVRATASTSWAGEGTFVVPIADPPPNTVAGTPGVVDPRTPNSAQDANRFAQSYSTLLVEDGALITHLAQATGLDAGDVVDGTEAVPVPDSPIIRVSFAAGTQEQVTAYFTALAAAFAETPAVTPNILPGNVEPLREVQVSEQRGLAPLAWVLGVLAALAVGLGGAVLLERADPRVRDDADVRELVTWPVLPAPDRDDDMRTEVLVDRAVRAARHVGAVGVLGLPGTPGHDVREATARLERVHAALRLRAPEHARPTAVEWVDAGTLAGDGAAERLAQEVDVVVLLTPVGARLRHLDSAVRSLQDLAVEAVVVALVPREQRPTRPTRPAADAPAAVAADPVGWASDTHEDHAYEPSPDAGDGTGYEPGPTTDPDVEPSPFDHPLTPRR